MNIDNTGLSLDPLKTKLSEKKENLKCIYGSDFNIKPEGVIDNFAVVIALLENKLEKNLVYLTKQFDPETAEGKYQDALYKRLGLIRIAAQPTTFFMNVAGTPLSSVCAGALTIRTTFSKEQFINSEDFTFDVSGCAVVNFQCEIEGAVSVSLTDSFEIVESPDEVAGLVSGSVSDIVTGSGQESDAAFRERFHNSKSVNARGSRNAVIKNLSQYVNNTAFLKIYDGNSDSSIPPGRVFIVAKHNTTDEVFARGIMDTVMYGVDFLGETSVTLTDKYGIEEEIRFQNAEDVPLDLSAALKIRSGYYNNTVFNNVRKKIISYIENRVFGLESTVYATEFIVPILEVDGVEAVTGIKVKRSSDMDYSESISVSRIEIPAFSENQMYFSEAS